MTTLFTANPEFPGANPGAALPGHHRELLAGQVHLLFRQTPSAFFATLFNAEIVGFVLWGQVPEAWLLGWVASVWLVTLARYGLVRAYYKAHPPPEAAPLWGRRFVAGVFIAGVQWGLAGGWFFVEGSYIHQLFLAFVLAGMAAGGMTTLSSSREAYLAFLVPLVIPYFLQTMAHGGAVHDAMGVMFLLFALMMWAISRRLYRTMADAILLRFDNLDLLKEVTSARDHQQAVNQELQIQIAAKERAQQALRDANEALEEQVRQRTEELVRSNEDLQRKKELFQVTLASIGDAVITTDILGNIAYLNPAAERFTGWNHREALGMLLTRVFHALDEATRDPIGNPVEDGNGIVQNVGHASSDILVRRDGQEFAIDHSVAPILDGKGGVAGAVLSFRDVTEQRGLAQKLAHQAAHDPLTGLLNRLEFERRLANALPSAREDHPHALLYLDLDQFKVVNDTCGHPAGDELLRQVTALFQSKIRSRDTLARLGGDEFGLILEACPQAEAVRVAHALRELVQKFRFRWRDKSFSIGVSIGLFVINRAELSLAEALSAADSACYAAKDAGRNRVHVYQPDDSDLLRRSGIMQWLPRIQQAMADERLCLFFQPIVPVKRKAGSGEYGEILLRLVDEQGNLVLPGAFLPSAERYDQMSAIDRWVVDRCLGLLEARHSRDGRAVTYAVNVSVQSLGDENFLDFVVDRLRNANIAPSSLCFEITENAALADPKHILRFIAPLKEMGCRFSLDDFGSGLTSFGHLKNIPLDYLKIDGRLVKDMASDPIDQSMVEAIHRIGHVMRLKTIAEWAEDIATLNLLEAMGVDYVQGFLLARPRLIGEPAACQVPPVHEH